MTIDTGHDARRQPLDDPQWLALDGAVNARVVVPGVLLRSDNLQDLSERDLRTLVDEQQLQVVLDLRTEIEIASEGPGPMTAEPRVRIDHRSLYPQMGNTDFALDGETINPWGPVSGDNHDREETPVVRSYLRYLRRRPDSVVEAVRTIASAEGAVLVHCAAGKDRTGVVVALALEASGVDRELIVSDYLVTAERIDAIMARLLSSPTYRSELDNDSQKHAPVPGTMERVLELIDSRYGGVVAYLRAGGMSEAELARLRSRINGA